MTNILREDYVLSLLCPQACLLVVVSVVLADIDVFQIQSVRFDLGVDLQAVAAVVAHLIFQDPDPIYLCGRGPPGSYTDAVVVFIVFS